MKRSQTRKKRPARNVTQGNPARKQSGEISQELTLASEKASQARKAAHQLHQQADMAHRQSEEAHLRTDSLHKEQKRASKKSWRPDKSGDETDIPGAKKTQPLEASAVEASSGNQPASALPFSVIGIGASAGGYEALSQLLGELPADTGMAFVIVQHLDPHHESRLSQLLSKATRMRVREVKSGVRVEPNNIYVLPPNASVTMVRSYLRLSSRQSSPIPMPIDIFFRSLAQEQQNRAIGVVLSGMGADGSQGMEEIKSVGGITFAQDKATARHFPMPSSAIGTGAVDFILSPERIATELARLAHHPYVAPAKVSHATPATDDAPSGENLFSESPEQLRQLFTLLRTRTGVDFSLYKPGTLNRRIMRRMVLKRVDRIEDYLPLLQEQADELDGLFNDLLISVTGFFRDPKTFELLRRRLLPKLLKKRTGDTPLRIWSCGCSTGEEAYSIAITVVEAMQKLGKHVPVQIFASDLNERGIEKARAGVYPENILLDVSQERLRRFFVKVDGKYQVAKHIRDMCVFARQNVATDPPFSNLDLISCRNVLIYLTPVLQRRIFPIFHYALRNGGYLMLGNSEGIGEHSELFELADRKNKLFVKKLAAYRPTIDFERRPAGATPKEPKPIEPGTMTARIEVDGSNLQQKVDRLLLSRFTPAGVVINSQMDTLQFRGKTAAYLEHHSGTASLNLLKMVHEDLALDLRRAVRKAIQTGEKVEHSCGRLRLSGATRTVRIEVYPFQAGSSAASERYYLVLFQDVAAPETRAKEGPQEPSRKIDARQIARLQDDLASTKESLQTIIEEQDATNEELKSANEEVQSSNEELQSTNEELETAREELQSTNEELSTLNQELQNRNNELGQLNNDLTNLLSSVHIAIIMMGTDLRIRRFTPMAEKIFNLIPSDVGRRLSDLNRNVNIPDLDEMIQQVIDHLNVVEREVQDREGHWYSLRIRPYRTQESMIDGVVLMLFDIDELKRSIRHIVGLIRHPVILLHGDMRVNRANEAFCEMFAVSPAEIEEKPFYEIAEKRWNFKAMRELLEEVLPRQGEVLNYRLTHDFPGLGRKKLLLNARRFYEESRGVQLFLLSLVEIKD